MQFTKIISIILYTYICLSVVLNLMALHSEQGFKSCIIKVGFMCIAGSCKLNASGIWLLCTAATYSYIYFVVTHYALLGALMSLVMIVISDDHHSKVKIRL